MVEAVMADKRPDFPTPEDWLDNYERCTAAGWKPWPPETAEELRLAQKHGVLQPAWIPNPRALKYMGLPETFGRPVEPFDEQFQERFIKTLRVNPEFAAAVGIMTEGI